jgi:hypothetical protein
MAHNPETPYLDIEPELATLANEHGETLEVVSFTRGQQPDDRLKLSLIRKVSPTGRFLPNRGWIPTTPNSFGLPPGETCPGKTDFCKSCYAFGSIRSQGVKEMLDHNFALLESLDSVDAMSDFLSEMIERYDQYSTASGGADADRVFRIHWSGDFYSLDYAEAWARTIRKFPHITFWAFTRSFRQPVDVIPILDKIDNLSLYLSTDADNINDIPAAYDHLPRANSATDVVRAQELARPGSRTITCPENLDRLKLMQDGEGACIKCRVCIKGVVDVNFVTSGKHDASPQSRFAANTPEQPVDISKLVIKPVNPARFIRRRPAAS